MPYYLFEKYLGKIFNLRWFSIGVSLYQVNWPHSEMFHHGFLSKHSVVMSSSHLVQQEKQNMV